MTDLTGQYSTGNTQRTLLSGGDPGAFLTFNRQSAQNVAQSVPPSQAFNLSLMNLLKQYQQLGTAPLQNAQLNASDLQQQRIQQTPQELIGAAPSVQSGVRNAAAEALSPTITGLGQQQKTFTEQLKSFGDVLNTAKSIGDQMVAAENKSRDDARSLIKDSFTLFGGAAFDNATPDEVKQMEKMAGLPTGYIEGVGKTVKERELELKKQNAALTGGLTNAQINQTVNSIRGAFDSEPGVKEYNTIKNQVQLVKTAGKTPTDDMSRIYAFAKVMDPNSVVRESEYASVQEYATSLLQRYGLKANRVVNNAGFLTDEARKFLQDTLDRRLKISVADYENIRKEYQRQIDDVRAGITPTLTQYNYDTEQPSTNEWEYVPDTATPNLQTNNRLSF